MTRHRRLLTVMFVVCAALVSGCGGKGKTVKVEGLVTLDGKPLPGATVIFTPVKGAEGHTAHGRTEADGSFKLTTYNTHDGALPGDYKITVDVLEGDKENQGKNPNEMDMKTKTEFFSRPSQKAKGQTGPKKATTSPVPAIYGDVKSTPLQQTVPAKGSVKLELSSKAR